MSTRIVLSRRADSRDSIAFEVLVESVLGVDVVLEMSACSESDADAFNWVDDGTGISISIGG